MLFGRSATAFIALIGLSSALCLVAHVQLRPSDPSRYRKLIQESVDLRSRRALEKDPVHQVREKVQKDIWTPKKRQRLHTRINGEYSELTLQQKKDKLEVIEDLQQVHALVEQTLHPLICSSLYFVSADEATYNGTDLVLTGACQMEHPMGLLQAGKATLSGSTHSLLLEEYVSIQSIQGRTPLAIYSSWATSDLASPLGLSTIRFYDDVLIETLGGIQASGAFALYQGQTLSLYPAPPSTSPSEEQIFLISDRLQNKESSALADQMVIHLAQQKAVLSANPPRRVLFWQEGLSLSAPEVHIQKDLVSQEEIVEGKGDVRFRMDQEEKKQIEQLLSR